MTIIKTYALEILLSIVLLLVGGFFAFGCELALLLLLFLEEKIMNTVKTYAKEILTAVVLLVLGSFCASLHLSLISYVLGVAGHYFIGKTFLSIIRERKTHGERLQNICVSLLCFGRKTIREIRAKIEEKEAEQKQS